LWLISRESGDRRFSRPSGAAENELREATLMGPKNAAGGDRRLTLIVIALVVTAAATITFGYVRTQREVHRVKVADLVSQPKKYEGKTVSLVLEYDRRSPDDPAAEFISRSDCHLHDETGSILLFGGWQVWINWKSSRSFASNWLDVSATGLWTVKRAVVRYTEQGLPYLEPPEGVIGG
jgi:hypothetical protein